MAAKEPAVATRKNGAGDTADLNDTIVLILAALGNPTVKCEALAGMDSKKRTVYAWQHRLRKWKPAAAALMAEHPDVVDGTAKTGAKANKNADGKAGKATANNANGAGMNGAPGDDEDAEEEVAVKADPRKRGNDAKAADAKKRRVNGTYAAPKPKKMKDDSDSDAEMMDPKNEKEDRIKMKKEESDAEDEDTNEDEKAAMIFERAV